MTVFEVLECLWLGFIARPELIIAAVVISAILIIGGYCELLEERRKTNERCRIISERSKMR
jgi:hypothetical protein